MKFISHRGNLTGTGSEKDPRTVDLAISKGTTYHFRSHQ